MLLRRDVGLFTADAPFLLIKITPLWQKGKHSCVLFLTNIINLFVNFEKLTNYTLKMCSLLN